MARPVQFSAAHFALDKRFLDEDIVSADEFKPNSGTGDDDRNDLDAMIGSYSSESFEATGLLDGASRFVIGLFPFIVPLGTDGDVGLGVLGRVDVVEGLNGASSLSIVLAMKSNVFLKLSVAFANTSSAFESAIKAPVKSS
jgi:hypothetical protein